MFGREPTRPILIDVINSVLHRPCGHQIEDLELLNPFNPKEAFDDNKVKNNLSVVSDGVDALAFLRKEGKYSDALAMQLTRDGARSVLRMNTAKLRSMPIFGDCGAFSYRDELVPPHTPANTAEFYALDRIGLDF